MRFNMAGWELQHMMHGHGKVPLVQGGWHLAQQQEDCGYLFVLPKSHRSWWLLLLNFVFPITMSCRSALVNWSNLRFFLKNTNASNFVENKQLTWLTQTWMDYWSSAELFFWDKNSSAGMKAFICQTLLQLKWRTCAISSWKHAYLHQPKEPLVQNAHMWALLICQHPWE